MKHLTLLISALLLLASTSALGAMKTYEGNAITPALHLQDMTGHTHDLSDYKGKVVMVQFWATYCPPCRKEMPSMNRLQEQLGEENFKILAINMGESQEEVSAFVDEVKPEFSILMDETGSSIGDWQVFAAPSTFIVDQDGAIRYTLFGGVEWDDVEIVDQIKTLMQ